MLEKTYISSQLEEKWHAAWDAISAHRDLSKPPLCLIMPPPNVTGSLHLGHALTFTLQDVWARFWRMRGADVLMQPGLDHAGIATQMVVERQLTAQGQDRHALGREAFLEKVWAWKEQSGGTILEQLKKLGITADWTRTTFTLDSKINHAVRLIFVELWKAGLIYRAKRLVNWDPVLLTALSDLEVLSTEVSGDMWTLLYPIAGEPNMFLEVATTRPETLFGDQAIAVHPEDERFKAFHGKKVVLPLVGREIPLILDDAVDMEKGTGAVKITPAHDFNDFEMGKRHGLDPLVILNERAALNEHVPLVYQGLDRFEARQRVLSELSSQGLLGETKAIMHAVPHGDRSNAILEPRLTDQWYLDASVLAKPALEAWEQEKLTFVPESYGETYAHWMRNIQPWCLSRQLWWGHPIPAWYGPDGMPFVAMDEEDAYAQAHSHYGHSVELCQETDVLDTWFSSALWPFVTLGWPDKTQELERYYPSQVLVTGFDIIFFWVARMVMMGLYTQHEVPFKDVYIHGLLRDANRQKMSKTKGNVVDPLELMALYGADALRLTLASLSTPGRDMAFDPHQVEGYRNFITKLWNATRFCAMKKCDFSDGSEILPPLVPKYGINQWLLHAFSELVEKITHSFESYKFYEASSLIYHFVWGTYCDWYIELVKNLLDDENEEAYETRRVAGWVLSQILRVLHPFIPFVTEELWAFITSDVSNDKKLLLAQAWPLVAPLTEERSCVFQSSFFPKAHCEITQVIEWITVLRSARTDMGISYKHTLTLHVAEASFEEKEIFKRYHSLLKQLLKLEDILFMTGELDQKVTHTCFQIVSGTLTFLIPLEEVLDLDAEKKKFEKKLSSLDEEMTPLQARLASPHFTERAKPEIVAATRQRLEDLEKEREKVQNGLKRICPGA